MVSMQINLAIHIKPIKVQVDETSNKENFLLLLVADADSWYLEYQRVVTQIPIYRLFGYVII